MTPVSSILCPVDFSEGSRTALCYAAALADHFGARLTMITVDDPLLAKAAAMEVLDPPLAVQSEAELRRFSDDVLPHLAARVKMREFRVATGKPAQEILRAVQATKADLIVIGSHGRSGLQKMFFGSTTERVLRETTVPVLITREARPASASLPDAARAIHRVLAPLDLTSASTSQVRFAAAIAEHLQVPLIVAHIVEPIFVPQAVRHALAGTDSIRRAEVEAALTAIEGAIPPGVTTENVVATGAPAEEIVRFADTRGANLIVMGLHSGGMLGPRMGAVTYRVLCSTKALVVALPPVPTPDPA
jgi:nucleotide-binding universal stress UspA family protein